MLFKVTFLLHVLLFSRLGHAKEIFDYQELLEKLSAPLNRVILLGEASHNDLGTKEAYLKIVQDLQSRLSEERLCLGVEQGRQFNYILEAYFESPRTEEAYEEIVQSYNQRLNDLIGPNVTIFTDRPRLPYFVLNALASLKLKIFGIDRDPFAKDADQWLEVARKVYNQKVKISWSPEKSSLQTKVDYIQEFHIKRNRSMAMNIKYYLNSDDCTKFIVLVGSAHILPWSNENAKDGMQRKLSKKLGLTYADVGEPIFAVQEILFQNGIQSYTAKISKHEKAEEITAIEGFEGFNLNYIYFPVRWSRPIKK